MSKSDFKVGCEIFSNKLMAGRVSKGKWVGVKHDVTDSAVNAVATRLLKLNEVMRFNYQGKRYELGVVEISPEEGEDNEKE